MCYVPLQYAMGGLWLVGFLKLQVSFAKETYKREYVLQKRPIILRSLLIVATPYVLTATPRASISGIDVLQCVADCCRLLQCVAVPCSVSQHVAACCSVLQCVAVCCSVLQYLMTHTPHRHLWLLPIRHSRWMCVVRPLSALRVCCSVWQCVAVYYSVLQCITVSYYIYWAQAFMITCDPTL